VHKEDEDLAAPKFDTSAEVRPAQLDFGQSMTLRIVNGPVHRYVIWIPVIDQDPETQKPRESWRTLKVADRNDHFFGPLAAAEKKFKALLTDTPAKEQKSQFDPNEHWVYWGIIKGFSASSEKPELAITRLAFPRSIFKRLREIQHKEHPSDPSKLMYGPLWAYDVTITKVKTRQPKPGETIINVTGYTVDPVPGNFGGKFPVDLAGAIPEGFDLVKEGVFPQEVFDLVDGFELDLDKEREPDSEETIVQRFSTIFIDMHRERNGVKIFPCAAELSEFLASKYNLLTNYKEPTEAPKAIPETTHTGAGPVGEGSIEQEKPAEEPKPAEKPVDKKPNVAGW